MRIGQAGADALAQKYNTRFTVGNIVDLLCKISKKKKMMMMI